MDPSSTAHQHPLLKSGEKCCCGFEPPKPPPPPKPKVNNLRTNPAAYCCGLVELGNFNYIDPPGGKKMTHYHKLGGWSVQQNADPTTKEEIQAVLKNIYAAGVICTTGAGQEYLEPVLEELGFKRSATFNNPGHAGTDVNLWFLNLKRG